MTLDSTAPYETGRDKVFKEGTDRLSRSSTGERAPGRFRKALDAVVLCGQPVQHCMFFTGGDTGVRREEARVAWREWSTP